MSQRTIHNRLSTFEDRPLNDALFDEQCAGGPRKRTTEEQEHLAVEFLDSLKAEGVVRHDVTVENRDDETVQVYESLLLVQ